MTSALEDPDMWRNFVFPFTQTLASLAIATYAMKQEKIARLNARRENSARFFKAYQGFCLLFDATVRIQEKTGEWQSAWFACRSAKEEAACLYGYHLDPQPVKSKVINDLFERGMLLCMTIATYAEVHGGSQINAGLINDTPQGNELYGLLDDLSGLKAELLKAMYEEMQFQSLLNDLIL
jgi:hypothetical protein